MIYRNTVLLLLTGMCCAGCSGAREAAASGTRYVYSYSMEQPQQSLALRFRDENIDIRFAIDDAAVTFEVTNLSDQQLSVVWEKVSLALDKRSYPVRSSTTFYATGSVVPLPLSVPPQGHMHELVIPWQNVNIEHGRWVEKEFFPVYDNDSAATKEHIQRTIGKEISLILPLRVGKLVIDYTFTFKVVAATPLSPGTPPPSKERPPMPDLPVAEATFLQGYLPIAISAGILTVAIILLTQKKSPAEAI